jgi:hypothetical protein
MKRRHWKKWVLVLALVVILAPGVVLAQESRPSIADEFTNLFAMIWNQLGLVELGPDISPNGLTTDGSGGDMGPYISPDGLTTGGSDNDLGGRISPDGLSTKGPNHDLGPDISPDGLNAEGSNTDLGPYISPNG